MKEKRSLDYVKDVVVSIFGSYVITFLGILVLALLLLMFQITENHVDIGILIIYILAGLTAGFIVGKRTGNRKFLWGTISGAAYFLILFLLSAATGQDVSHLGSDLTTTLLICIGSGTLGGMLS